ncbi:Aste57867_24190 [Aphanomyces stellatus]|uniref:Aste57867_24190 protein n=1 Tax=Aphanomyces stellatus TaxID=120398 RepID=A0A485LPN6_9STRA|nr:hypothetical protein As57867_024116 [Aphanomyces stellatus]VFU00832.1 Aste57867_24190 [Aphanomyces stellatus]
MPVVVATALAAISFAASANFSLSVLSTMKDPFHLETKKHVPWAVFPLPGNQHDIKDDLAVQCKDEKSLSIWEAISRLGRVYYMDADDPAIDADLAQVLEHLQAQAKQMSSDERLSIGSFAFTPQDLWEGEALYQFLQGLVLTSQDRQDVAVEASAAACLEVLYASYKESLVRAPVVACR